MNFKAELVIDDKVIYGDATILNRKILFSSKDKLHQKTFDEYTTIANYGKQNKICITSTTDAKVKMFIFDPVFAVSLSRELDIKVKSSLVSFLNKNENFTYIIAFIGIIFFGIVLTLLSKFGSRYISHFISFELEQKIGQQAFNSSFESTKVNLTPEAEILWQTIIKKIMSSNHNIDHDVQFYINKDAIPNAFALPGGLIIVNTGLIKEANSVEELLGVLAHELAHVKYRDSLNSIVERFGTKVLLGGSNLTSYTSQIGYLKNSRAQETRADIYAVKILNSAKISTQGFVSFFEKLSKNDKTGITYDWFSTHPRSEGRILKIKTQGNLNFTRIDFPWTKFQELTAFSSIQ